MRQASYNLFAIAALLGGFVLTAGYGQAKAKTTPKTELTSIDDVSKALGIDSTSLICTGGRGTRNAVLYSQKVAGLSQMPNDQLSNPAAAAGGAQYMAPKDHSHIPVAVPQSAPVPKLSVSLTKDVMSGYNLSLKTENYDMTAPPIGVAMEELLEPSLNDKTGFVQGHAHLYINSEKIQRVYGNNVHIPASYFKDGMNQLNITINSHAHMFWTSDDKQIISSLFINTSSPKLLMYQFDSFPVDAK